mmetsp:Transcript_23433/g.54577  ORF Transcript_23433/g.54577 Transcript_23433/m.54577 type:complete len:732 (-) Transcript_23433:92-2287(-)
MQSASNNGPATGRPTLSAAAAAPVGAWHPLPAAPAAVTTYATAASASKVSTVATSRAGSIALPAHVATTLRAAPAPPLLSARTTGYTPSSSSSHAAPAGLLGTAFRYVPSSTSVAMVPGAATVSRSASVTSPIMSNRPVLQASPPQAAQMTSASASSSSCLPRAQVRIAEKKADEVRLLSDELSEAREALRQLLGLLAADEGASMLPTSLQSGDLTRDGIRDLKETLRWLTKKVGTSREAEKVGCDLVPPVPAETGTCIQNGHRSTGSKVANLEIETLSTMSQPMTSDLPDEDCHDDHSHLIEDLPASPGDGLNGSAPGDHHDGEPFSAVSSSEVRWYSRASRRLGSKSAGFNSRSPSKGMRSASKGVVSALSHEEADEVDMIRSLSLASSGGASQELQEFSDLMREKYLPKIGILRLDGPTYSAPVYKKDAVVGDVACVATWTWHGAVSFERVEGYTFACCQAGLKEECLKDNPIFAEPGILLLAGDADDPGHLFVPNTRDGCEPRRRRPTRTEPWYNEDGSVKGIKYIYESAQLLENLQDAINTLVDDCQVHSISGACGFMGNVQALCVTFCRHVPCLMSSLEMLPLIRLAMPPHSKVLILTANGAWKHNPIRYRELIPESWGVDDLIEVVGLENVEGFGPEVAAGETVDCRRAEKQILHIVRHYKEKHLEAKGFELGAIVSECTELPGYSNALRVHFKVPVMDMLTVCHALSHAVVPRPDLGMHAHHG